MPIPIEDLISVSAPPQIAIKLEPVQNILHSLVLMSKAENLSGLGDWIQLTRERMSPEELRTHRLVMFGFHYAVLPDRSWTSFTAYLDHLESMPADDLRKKLLDSYAAINRIGPDEACMTGPGTVSPYDQAAILGSLEAYLDFLLERFDDQHIDLELEAQAYEYVLDPPVMQSLIVSHLRHMWDKYVAKEWKRISPMLLDSVRAFSQIDISQMSKLEVAQMISGQELEQTKWQKALDKTERVEFVPNAHIGPYLSMFHQGDVLGIMYGARLPEGSHVYAPDLSRTEILVRLSALADDNRLRILQYISEEGELRSQEIMDGLDLSQSAASRHLKQLSATGYISERRCEGAKCYTLNPERIEETLQAVASFILGSEVSHIVYQPAGAVVN